MEPLERAAAALIEHEQAMLESLGSLRAISADSTAMLSEVLGKATVLESVLAAVVSSGTPETRGAAKAALGRAAAQIGPEGSLAHATASAALAMLKGCNLEA